MPTVRLYGPQWAVRMTISGPIGGILCLYAIGANGRDSAGMKTTRLRFLEPGLLYFIGFYQNNPSCAGNKRRKEHIEQFPAGDRIYTGKRKGSSIGKSNLP